MSEFKRKLASVMNVDEKFSITNSDNLELLRLDGWLAVVTKDKFNVNDKVVYIETDSLLPDKPEFSFMESRKYRVKQIKLRGQLSDGLVFKFEDLVSYNLNPTKYNIGDDLTDKLGIKHYQKIAEDNKQNGKNPTIKKRTWKWYLYKAKVKLIELFIGNIGALAPWPGVCPKTDEPQIRHVYNAIKDKYIGQPCEVHEKLNGASLTLYFYNNTFGVCSRNYELISVDNKPMPQWKKNIGLWLAKKFNIKVSDNTNDYWKWVKDNDIYNKVKSKYPSLNVALQLELCGGKVSGNMYKFPDLRAYLFNIWDINGKFYWNSKQVDEFCENVGIKRVPKLGNIELHDDLQKYINDCTCKSTLADCIMEGHVIRPVNEIYDNHIGRLSFKVINPQFKAIEDKTLGLE